MSTEATTKMLSMYKDNRPPTTFLASKFRSPAENFHNSEGVEIDIQRSQEEVAIAITDLVAGYNFNSNDLYTNKRFIPPIFKEAFAINAYDMIKRLPGNTPFEDPQFQASAMKQFLAGMIKAQEKIIRAVELQTSQILQTGTATLINAAGASVYSIDYSPKATHFPTASPIWSNGSATIAADLEGLMDVIRNDGKLDPKISIWDMTSFNTAMANTNFRALFDATTKIDRGGVVMGQDRGNGAKYRGTIEIGHYPLEIWTYEGRYKHIQTGTITEYIDGGVVVMAEPTRLDMTWGNVPLILPPERRVLPFVPPRVSVTGAGGMDMITNTWTTDDGEQLFGGVSARPLAIPTAIDTFGRIASGV